MTFQSFLMKVFLFFLILSWHLWSSKQEKLCDVSELEKHVHSNMNSVKDINNGH